MRFMMESFTTFRIQDERAFFFLFAALAPSLPSAVRVFFGRFATVRFFLAALAAFLMFFLAALRCLAVAMVAPLPLGHFHDLEFAEGKVGGRIVPLDL
jgi:hypothetical protein